MFGFADLIYRLTEHLTQVIRVMGDRGGLSLAIIWSGAIRLGFTMVSA
jgi:hypothetical protein